MFSGRGEWGGGDIFGNDGFVDEGEGEFCGGVGGSVDGGEFPWEYFNEFGT